MNVLTWHVHGSYLYYLSCAPHTFYLPVRRDDAPAHGGRAAGRFAWPDNVVDVPAEEVPDLDLDVVLTQSVRNWESDRHALLSPRQARNVARVHLEHDPPPGWPNDARHPVDDDETLLVHVTPFNALMWDSGDSPVRVIEHGVVVDPDLTWTGERDRAVTVVNNLYRRGRRLGPDIFDTVAAEVPVDLAGMNGDPHPGWLGDIALDELHPLLASYRVLFNPVRYTSLGLAVCEAMALGLPVVGLATTEMSTAVENGVSGYVDTRPDLLVGHLQRLLADPAEAAALSAGARKRAAERFGVERFAVDWDRVLREAAEGAWHR